MVKRKNKMRKPIIKGCKHPEIKEATVEAAKKGDLLAFLYCEECGTVMEWKYVKATKGEQAELPKTDEVAVKPEPQTVGRPTKTKARPKVEKPKVKPSEDEAVQPKQVEGEPILHSNDFETVKAEADGDHLVITAKTDKGHEFSIRRESTPEKIANAMKAINSGPSDWTITVEYTEVDVNFAPVKGEMKKITKVK